MDTTEITLYPVEAMEDASHQSHEAHSQRRRENQSLYSAYNGRGPWWNAGAYHMNVAIPVKWLTEQGLLSLLEEHRRLSSLT